MGSSPALLEVEVRPPWPYRLPRHGRADGAMRKRGGVLSRLLHVEEQPVVVHVWQPARDRVVFRAIEARAAEHVIDPDDRPGTAVERGLEVAVERMRFAVGVDEDLGDFAREFKRDPLIGPAIHRQPWLRVTKRPWPWEALAWAVTEQLIEVSRAAEIQRWIVKRWGRRLQPGACEAWDGPGPLRDVPGPGLMAGRAPAELAAYDLAPRRCLALLHCAREIAAGRVDPADPACDERLIRIANIGPWTLQCLGLMGRGEADSLPAGDLAYVKLVGSLAGLGRRATVAEVEDFFAPYAPYRGLAGAFALAGHPAALTEGSHLPLAA